MREYAFFAVERKRVEFGKEHHHADEHADIADTRRQERFFACIRRGILLEPETDEEIGAEPYQLPTDVNAEQVIRDNEEQHGEREEREEGEKPRVPRVAVHIAHRENVDEAAYQRDDNQHDDRDAVKVKPHREADVPDGNPLHRVRRWIRDDVLQ